MKLLRVLHVQVPQVDPSLFLERFAAQMNLGDKVQSVAQTAVRLVQVIVSLRCRVRLELLHLFREVLTRGFASEVSTQAMARDWISTGRRPMGLCGAALLIAARYHGIRIDAEDIANVRRQICTREWQCPSDGIWIDLRAMVWRKRFLFRWCEFLVPLSQSAFRNLKERPRRSSQWRILPTWTCCLFLR